MQSAAALGQKDLTSPAILRKWQVCIWHACDTISHVLTGRVIVLVGSIGIGLVYGGSMIPSLDSKSIAPSMSDWVLRALFSRFATSKLLAFAP